MVQDSKNTSRKRSRPKMKDKVKQGDKRSRRGMMEAHSRAKISTNATLPVANKSDCGLTQGNKLVITEHGNEHMGSQWDWDGYYKEMELDIKVIISEYGDFSDFFEDDALPLGEPPRKSEMQTPLVSTQYCGTKRSRSANLKEDSDQMLMQVPTIQSISITLNNSLNHMILVQDSLLYAQDCYSKRSRLANLKDDSNEILMQVPTIQRSSLNLNNSSNQTMLVRDPLLSAQDCGSKRSRLANIKDDSNLMLMQVPVLQSSSMNLNNSSNQTMRVQDPLLSAQDFGTIRSSSMNLNEASYQPCQQAQLFPPQDFVTTRSSSLNLTNFSDRMLMQSPLYSAPNYGSISSSSLDLTNVSGPRFQSPSFPHFQNSEQPAASATENLLRSNRQATYDRAGFVPTVHDSDLTYFSDQMPMQKPQYFAPDYGSISSSASGLTGVTGQTFQSPGISHFQNSEQPTASAPGNFITNNQQAKYNTVGLAPTIQMPLSFNGHGIIDVEEYCSNMERRERLIDVERMRIKNNIQQQAMSWIS